MSEDHTGELCSEIRIGSLRVGCCSCCPLVSIKRVSDYYRVILRVSPQLLAYQLGFGQLVMRTV